MTPNSDVALAILGAFGVITLLSLMGVYLVIGMAWEKTHYVPVAPAFPRAPCQDGS